MSSEPVVSMKPVLPKNLCPICGKPSYSLGGVHPQCAIEQADRPRILKLRAIKAAESTELKRKKQQNGKWKKRCPKCGIESHVRLHVCRCGHNFSRR